MGFSAGAELAAAAALEYDAWDEAHAATPSASGASLAGVTSRPDFVGLIYPGPTPFQNKESRAITGATRLQGGGWEEGSEPDPVPPPIPSDVPCSFIATPSSGDQIRTPARCLCLCMHILTLWRYICRRDLGGRVLLRNAA